MKERFEGENRSALVDGLRRQEFAAGDMEIVTALEAEGSLEEFGAGEKLIMEGASGGDNDVFLLLAGSVSVVIKGQEVRTLRAGQHVGEMAAIEPAQPRSASVIAVDTVVALRIKGNAFVQLCDRFPTMWKPIAKELSRRLYDRNRLMQQPNEKPKIFIISSSEALDVARGIQSGLARDALCTVWTDGVFWAGGYPLEVLEQAVAESDFGVAVAQFDDIVQSRNESRPTMRDNVLFELGIFMGKLSRQRTILVHPRQPGLTLPSDLHGLIPACYEMGDPKDLPARLAPVCNEIRNAIKLRGVRVPTP